VKVWNIDRVQGKLSLLRLFLLLLNFIVKLYQFFNHGKVEVAGGPKLTSIDRSREAPTWLAGVFIVILGCCREL